MVESGQEERQSGVRVAFDGHGDANVATGLAVLDRLLGLLAQYAALDLALEVAPGGADEEVAAAGTALGRALHDPLRGGARGYGSAVMTADEALAHVALEASGRPLVRSNVDLSEERIAGLRSDLVAGFLRQFAEGAGLTMHVRLIDGQDTQHVLEAIFKALGVALSQAARPRGKES